VLNCEELIGTCVAILSTSFYELSSGAEWEREWLSLEREQLAEFLRSSDVRVASEYELWLAVVRWFQSPAHPDRRGAAAEKTLAHLVPLVRCAHTALCCLSSNLIHITFIIQKCCERILHLMKKDEIG